MLDQVPDPAKLCPLHRQPAQEAHQRRVELRPTRGEFNKTYILTLMLFFLVKSTFLYFLHSYIFTFLHFYIFAFLHYNVKNEL